MFVLYQTDNMLVFALIDSRKSSEEKRKKNKKGNYSTFIKFEIVTLFLCQD